MKVTSCYDINYLLDNDIDISYILNEVRNIMKVEYPDYVEWFDNKLIPGLRNDRNIVILLENYDIIGFVNLKKTKKENKMSNIYIKSSFSYKKNWNILIDKAVNWLEDTEPVIIVSRNEISKCGSLINERCWYASDKIGRTDIVFNRPNEIEKIKRYLKKSS